MMITSGLTRRVLPWLCGLQWALAAADGFPVDAATGVPRTMDVTQSHAPVKAGNPGRHAPHLYWRRRQGKAPVYGPPTAGSALVYNGGAVISNVQVVVVLWGAGTYLPQISGAVSPNMASMYQGVLSTSYVDWLYEYHTDQGVSAAGNLTTNQQIGRGSFLGQYTITPSAASSGSTVTDDEIQAELQAQIAAHQLPAPTVDSQGNANTYYALFFPQGTLLEGAGGSSCGNASGIGGGDFCAYHNNATTPVGNLRYGVHPSLDAPGPAGLCPTTVDNGCGPAGATSFQAQTQVSSHELVEAMTDADVGVGTLGWYSNTDGEIGDMCNDKPGTLVASDGQLYDVQQEFSNQQHGCVISAPGGLALGGQHTCSLTAAGVVQCWGANGSGQLGNGTTVDSDLPVTVSGLPDSVPNGDRIVAITAGSAHTCALSSASEVYCWGLNDAGQLGNGSTASASSPVAVSGLAGTVVAIAAGNGGKHTCALLSDGTARCWGHNANGQLGNQATSDSSSPVRVHGLPAAVALAAGAAHTCALGQPDANSGLQSVYCWGANGSGQLGNGSTADSLAPVQVDGNSLPGFDPMLAAGANHNCALMTNAVGATASVYCWGLNSSGQIGDGTTSNALQPVAVSGLTAGVGYQLALGDLHSCLQGIDGTSACWGSNSAGQLGNHSTADSSVPVSVGGLAGTAVALYAGTGRSCAQLGSGGQPFQCWGANASGQLGNGSTAGALVPVTVSGVSLYPAPLAQTITFPAIGQRALSSGTLTPTVSASSALPVTLGSATPAVCSVADLTVTLLSLGVCTLNASQGGNPVYAPAPPVTQSFRIGTTAGPPPFARPHDDFNGDGKGDLLWTNGNGTIAMWLMNGTTPLAQATFGPYSGWSLLSGDGDFNGDGKNDLVWTHTNGAVSIWLMNGTTPLSQTVFGPYAGWTLLSANSDFNGDGKSDLLWVSSNGQVAIWLMNGDAPVSQVAFGPFAGWSVVSGNNDFNGDGRSDLLWTHTSGAAAVWLMNGTSVSSQASYGPYSGWTAVSGNADYDGDGKSDLLWSNSNGAIALWLMNGTTVGSRATFGPFSGWSIASGNRDFNGDGRSDLLWTNASGAAAVWLMNGTSATSQASFGPFGGWSVVNACGDYNGDGLTDLLWSSTSGAAATWLMNGVSAQSQVLQGPFTGWTIAPGRTLP